MMKIHCNTIRLPLILGHTLFAGLLFLLAWMAVIFFLRPGLEKIEYEAAVSLVERFKLEVQTEMQSVLRVTSDWASWDELYAFVQTRTPQFINTNIVPTTFRNGGFNALAVIDFSGKVIIAQQYDPARDLLAPLAEFDQGAVPENFRFILRIKKGEALTGIWRFNGQLSLFAAKAVTTSNEEKAVNGILVMAMPLDESTLQSISKKLRVKSTMTDVSQQTRMPDPDTFRIVQASETITEVYTILADAAGTPQRLVRLDMPRVLYGIGWKSVKSTIMIALGAIAVLTVGLVVFTKYLVSIPLQRLSEIVATLGEAENLDDLQRLPLERNDEIGVVARAVKKMHERILYLANHDALTQLPNRKVFRTAFDSFNRLRKRQIDQMGVLVLDLDGFKPINDTHGHPAGDRVLQEVALRLGRIVRDEDVVARTGGDEFAILCRQVLAEKDLAAVAQKVLQGTQAPISLESGKEVVIGMSIGGCLVSEGATLDQVLSAADKALYEAKGAGKNTYRIARGL